MPDCRIFRMTKPLNRATYPATIAECQYKYLTGVIPGGRTGMRLTVRGNPFLAIPSYLDQRSDGLSQCLVWSRKDTPSCPIFAFKTYTKRKQSINWILLDHDL